MIRGNNIIIILLLLIGSANSSTYYVSNSGNNSNNGLSTATPWQTISYTLANMAGGDTVLFMGGTWHEENSSQQSDGPVTLPITDALSGTAEAWTVFKAAPGYDRPIFTGDFAAGHTAVELDYPLAAYVVLDSLIVKHSLMGIIVWMGNSASTPVTIKNCVVDSTYGENNGGINFPGGSGTLREDIIIQACTLFHNYQFDSPDNYGGINSAGIEAYGLQHSLITQNVIFDQPGSQGGIFFKQWNCDYNEVSYNTIFDCDAGITMYHSANGNNIHHNVIYDCDNGIRINSGYMGTTNYNNVYNNTIYNCLDVGLWPMTAGETVPIDYVSFWNNIVINFNDNSFGIGYSYTPEGNSGLVTNLYSDYNCFYNSADINDAGKWSNFYGNSLYYTLAELRSSKNIDTNSVVDNPLIENGPGRDFRLTVTSPVSVVSGGRGGAYLSYMGAYDPNVATFTISGTILLNGGGGLAGVTLSGLPGNPQTDNGGYYLGSIPSGWSGTATPVLMGYSFLPQSRTYSGVNSDMSNQNYTAWPDSLPPIFSNVEAIDITDRSATINWNTDELSTTQLEYGLTISYGINTSMDTTLALAHSVELDNLIADTLYYFRGRSIDASGNVGISGDFTFRTLEPDTARPVISGVTVSNLTSRSALIEWTTNEIASSRVEYGFTSGYGQSSDLDSILVQDHNVSLIGLQDDTLYHFRVRSLDGAGNEAISDDFILHTDTLAALELISDSVSLGVCGTYSGYDTSHIHNGIIDPRGGTSSTWASDQSSQEPHWVEMDFGFSHTVTRVIIYWAWNSSNLSWMCSEQYNIQYWDSDSSSFIDIASVSNNPTDSITITDFSAVRTNRIRFFQPPGRGAPSYPSILWITELEIYGEAGIPAPDPIGTEIIIEDSSAIVTANPVNAQQPIFYEFALDVNPIYPNPIIEPPLIIDTVISTTFDNLSSEFTYYWRCRAIASDLSDTSNWSISETFNLLVSSALQASEVNPANASTVTSSYQTFEIKFYPVPENIYFEVDGDPDFSSPLRSGPISSNNEGFASWQPDSIEISAELSKDGVYFWRASVDNAEWSEFTVTVKLDIHAYPVPFRKSSGHSQITFTNLPENSRISIASVSGTIVFSESGVGPGEWAWDVKNDKGRELASGVYLYAIDSKGGSAQGKIVVIK